MRVKWLLFSLIILQLLDAATTVLALRAGARELNPIVELLLANPVLLILAKITVAFASYLVIMYSRSKALAIFIYMFYLQAIIFNLYNCVVISQSYS